MAEGVFKFGELEEILEGLWSWLLERKIEEEPSPLWVQRLGYGWKWKSRKLLGSPRMVNLSSSVIEGSSGFVLLRSLALY